MKFFFLSLISLFLLGFSYARTIEYFINDLATMLEMPELRSISDEQELYWFVDRDHITDPVFFFSALMNELKNPNSFPQNRQLIAKYGLRKYLRMSPNDRDIVGEQVARICVDILVKNNDFESLFELVISFEFNIINLLNSIEVSKVKLLVEALVVSSLSLQFMDVIGRHEHPTVFLTNLFSELILSNAPEYFYFNILTSRFDLLLTSCLKVIAEYAARSPVDLENLNRINDFIYSINSPQAQQLHSSVKDAIKIISSPDDVTLADLNINLAEMDLNAKMAMTVNASNHGKPVLLRQIIAGLSGGESANILKNVLYASKTIKPSGLKTAVRMYNLMSESDRVNVQESEEYLIAAIQWLKFENLILSPDSEYFFKLTFKADAEQIADGLFEKMVYYQRRDRPIPLSIIVSYGFELKFNSPEAFKNFISQDIRTIFAQNNPNFSLPCSKDTLMLLSANEDLRCLAAGLEYKIAMQKTDFLDFIKETSLETIPKFKDLLRSPFVDLDILSNINDPSNFVKIEKFTDSSIVDIVNQVLNSIQRSLDISDYFKIRGALIYSMGNTSNFRRLNELPSLIKELLVKEFNILNIN